jgi:predicted transcriptional regulator
MRLKSWLDLNGVKPINLAKQLDVNLATVYRYVSGDRDPGLLMAARIRDFTRGGVSIDDMAETLIERKASENR